MELGDGLFEAEEAYRKYGEELIRFATGLVGPWDAGDLVAGALESCMRAQAVSVRDPRAYLFRAVLNEARQVRRSAIRRAAREAKAAGPSEPHEPEVRWDVIDAVARLSVRQRAVIVLTYWDDLRPDDVALRLGISEGAVRRHLARARARLRGVLRE